MIRKIIKIDQSLCNGCGLCANACHEGAIAMVDGKATLMREDYCDGLGDCLPVCPTGAITFEERDAPAYDHEAVMAAKAGNAQANSRPGQAISESRRCPQDMASLESQLLQWPVQIKLLPIRAPYFNAAHLLVAADCTAFAYGDFHRRLMKGRITLIGCPKLDSVDYSEKLAAIFSENEIQAVTVARMEVPCCGGLEYAVKKAIQASGKAIPLEVVTISTQGQILS